MDMHKFGGVIVVAIRRVAVLLGLRQELPVHPFTGMRAIGVLPSGRPVWPVLGGAPDDEDEDDEETDDDVEGEEEDEEDDDEDVEDKSKGKAGAKKDGEGKKDAGKDEKPDVVSRSELQKAVAERQRAKKALRETRAELDQLKQANENDADKAAREAREAADAAAETRYKPIAIRAALLEAGIKPTKVKGAARLLDMAEIEVDDAGDVTGLDDQLDSLKEEWPELFASGEAEDDGEQRQRRRSVGSRSVDGADKERKRKPLTASERQAAQLLGRK